MTEAYVDQRGRILLPDSVKEELGLKPEQKLEVRAKGRKLVLLVPEDATPYVAEERSGDHPGDPQRAKDLWVSRNPPY